MKNKPNKIKKYCTEARERTNRRKSPWNLILIPLTIIGITASGVLMALVIINLRSHVFPKEAIFTGPTRIGNILMFVPIIFPSMGIGMMFANGLAWLIPAARHVFNKEAKPYKNASFNKSMKYLGLFTLLFTVLALPLVFVGANNYFYITQKGIFYNPLMSMSQVHYRWEDIKKIRVRCLAERNNLHLNYRLIMVDGKKVDLMEEAPLKFAQAYPQIKHFIQNQESIQYATEITDWGLRRLNKRYNAKNARMILNVLE